MKILKYFLRTFGLITVRDACKLLDEEAKYQSDLMKGSYPEFNNLPDNERNGLIQHRHTQLSHYSEMCRNLKPAFYLLNAWWTK